MFGNADTDPDSAPVTQGLDASPPEPWADLLLGGESPRKGIRDRELPAGCQDSFLLRMKPMFAFLRRPGQRGVGGRLPGPGRRWTGLGGGGGRGVGGASTPVGGHGQPLCASLGPGAETWVSETSVTKVRGMPLIPGDAHYSLIPYLPFAPSLTLLVTLRSIVGVLSWPFAGGHGGKTFESSNARGPSRVRTKRQSVFCFSSQPVNKCLFRGLVSVTFLAFLCFLLAILLLTTSLPPRTQR